MAFGDVLCTTTESQAFREFFCRSVTLLFSLLSATSLFRLFSMLVRSFFRGALCTLIRYSFSMPRRGDASEFLCRGSFVTITMPVDASSRRPTGKYHFFSLLRKVQPPEDDSPEITTWLGL